MKEKKLSYWKKTGISILVVAILVTNITICASAGIGADGILASRVSVKKSNGGAYAVGQVIAMKKHKTTVILYDKARNKALASRTIIGNSEVKTKTVRKNPKLCRARVFYKYVK